ncbi:hypothetical protein [Rubritalea tangerina]|uniref:Large, multifunctional secreted protein n=1 Tax=Rubritalea tangerina TaxID=430798 RepID=A0ABW4ZFF6_9BACT
MEVKIIGTMAVAAVMSSQWVEGQIRKGDVLPQTDSEQSQYYVRELIPMPKGEVLEVGSLALMPEKRLAIATRRGEIWICDGAYGEDLSKVKWSLAFSGAHEPLGMFYKDGWLHFTDREAYGRIRDIDGDGRYDEYQVLSNQWGITGDYHEYAFGSSPDKNGDVWTVHCLTGSGRAKAQWRGWCLRITPDGKTIPTCSGVRSPGGIGFNHVGDAFYTDNQGLWNGTSCIKHLKPGSFTGNPTGNVYYDQAPEMGKRPKDPVSGSRISIEADRIPEYVPPAIQVPHGKVGQSPTALISESSKGKFSPFTDQLLVGEQTHSQVQRAYLEKVNGVYQGAIWKFLDGFECGIVPMQLAEDGTLFVGGTNRGWASVGPKTFTLERVRWNGVVPFEMLTMEAARGGFTLRFTEPLDREIAEDIANYKVAAWTYIYQKSYGSPEVDKVTPKVLSAELSEDGKLVRILLDTMIKGHVHHLDCNGLRSKSGKALWHPNSYYTLNEIPGE